jgi:hypothetical protein
LPATSNMFVSCNRRLLAAPHVAPAVATSIAPTHVAAIRLAASWGIVESCKKSKTSLSWLSLL